MLDYKSKYRELKAKMIESTDLAYRLGFEDGSKQAQQQAMQDQMMQMQQAQMAAQQQIDPATGQPIPQDPNAMGGQPGMGAAPGGMPMDPMAAAGGQPPMMDPNMGAMGGDPGMDQGNPSELDSYINELEGLVSKGQKPNVTDLRKTVTELANLRKAQKAKVKDNESAITASQKKLVNGILKKWETESKMTSENLENVLKESGIKIK